MSPLGLNVLVFALTRQENVFLKTGVEGRDKFLAICLGSLLYIPHIGRTSLGSCGGGGAHIAASLVCSVFVLCIDMRSRKAKTEDEKRLEPQFFSETGQIQKTVRFSQNCPLSKNKRGIILMHPSKSRD